MSQSKTINIRDLNSNDEKESAVLSLASDFIASGDLNALLNLLTCLPSNWDALSTARLTKIIKHVLSLIHPDQSSFHSFHALLNGLVYAFSDKKMLKLDLECRLINLYLSAGKYKECLENITKILKELKKYDDKVNLISLYVYESRAHYELQDFPRAKSSLTSARALAVSSACPAQLQAQIDLLNGMYLTDEKGFDTAISYFMEAFEGFLQDKLPANAAVALRYTVLNKILLSRFDDIASILSAKYAAPFRDDQFIAFLCSIAKICKKRDLGLYNDLLTNNSPVLERDAYATRHLLYLYNHLLDRNILKIIEPYSHVRIDFISGKIRLPVDVVEDKLRKMILDKSISGILDHDTQCLILYDGKEVEKSGRSLKVIREYFTEA